MRIAIVHDDLVQWGGAERVLEGICEVFPDAPIYTSVFNRDNKELKKRFGDKKIITSFLQKILGWKTLYKLLLPLYPIAFEQFNFDQFDLVISHTTRFAKSIITKPKTLHICYCHTPPRFLWHFSGEINYGIGELLLSKIRLYDQVSANRVDCFLAGSKNAQRRIKRIYKRSSRVVYPFVDLERFENIETFDGGYFLVISRLNKYKKIDLVIQACIKLAQPLKIIGNGPQIERLKVMVDGKKVEFLSNLKDEDVRLTLAGTKALIVPAIEDFGLVSLEAQALGKPVLAYGDGGSLETVIDKKTGIFFGEQSVRAIINAISTLKSIKINPKDCQDNAKRFGKDLFVKNFKRVIASLG